MARLEPAAPRGLDPIRRLTRRAARRMYGRPLEPLGVIAHHPGLLFGYGMIGLLAERARTVDPRLKSLAMLRTAQLVGCEWCLDFGSWHAVGAGLSEEQLRGLSRWRESEAFGADERLVLEYAEAMTRTPVEVGEDLFAALRERFDARQLVELTMAVGLENLHSRMNWAFGIEGQGFTEGMYCVRPEAGPAANSAARAVAGGAPAR